MKINARGLIVDNSDKWIYGVFGMDCIAPVDFDNAIASGEDLEIDINSNGGSVNAGSDIYTKLRAYKGKVTINITGLAASSASVIAMAGDQVNISPVGRIMIHNVTSGGVGDYHDMDKISEILKTANESLANAYESKTGISRDEILDMMDKETWLTADRAVELGFADSIMSGKNQEPELVASLGSPLPKAVIAKFKDLMDENEGLKKHASVVKFNFDETMLRNALDDAIKKYQESSKPKNQGFRAFLF